MTKPLPAWAPWGAAVATGLLLGLSQPKVDWNLLAWIAWVPLILAVRGQTPGRVFKLAYAAHFVAFAVLLYWIEVVVRVYGGVPIALSWIPMTLLTAYCALFMSVAFWWARRVELAFPRLSMLWTLPVLITAGEWVRGVLFTGFPWGHPAYSQYRLTRVIQMVDITGIDGLLFVLVLASAGIVAAVDYLRTRRNLTPAVTALVVVAAVLLYGNARYSAFRDVGEGPDRSLKVALLQGNIEQSLKWDDEFRVKTLDIYDRLAREAAGAGAELIIWPETAAPFYFRPGREGESMRLQRLVRDTGVPALIGAPAVEVRNEKPRFLNRAYLLDSEGGLIAWYDKMHLVPFGEYLPLPWAFGWIERLIPAVGNFVPGERRRVLAVPGARFGTLICFESIFPDEARLFVKDGADFLTVITNDAWFLRTSATYQHVSMAVLRAVENRVPVLQAGNTGVTAVIDADGSMREPLAIFEESTMVESIGLQRAPTIYTRYGDVFAYATLILTALSVPAVRRRRKGADTNTNGDSDGNHERIPQPAR